MKTTRTMTEVGMWADLAYDWSRPKILDLVSEAFRLCLVYGGDFLKFAEVSLFLLVLLSSHVRFTRGPTTHLSDYLSWIMNRSWAQHTFCFGMLPANSVLPGVEKRWIEFLFVICGLPVNYISTYARVFFRGFLTAVHGEQSYYHLLQVDKYLPCRLLHWNYQFPTFSVPGGFRNDAVSVHVRLVCLSQSGLETRKSSSPFVSLSVRLICVAWQNCNQTTSLDVSVELQLRCI